MVESTDSAAIHSGVDDERERVVEVRRRFALLTPRERAVVHQVLDGRLNKQIAATLGIPTRTVKLHRTSIRKKLGIRSVVQLATLACDARFLEPLPLVVAGEQRAHRP
jgi:FixJ family two-component response regulator